VLCTSVIYVAKISKRLQKYINIFQKYYTILKNLCQDGGGKFFIEADFIYKVGQISYIAKIYA
jgi:hypothetical protein